jgi:hypothetical protein
MRDVIRLISTGMATREIARLVGRRRRLGPHPRLAPASFGTGQQPLIWPNRHGRAFAKTNTPACLAPRSPGCARHCSLGGHMARCEFTYPGVEREHSTTIKSLSDKSKIRADKSLLNPLSDGVTD